jgi:hypothetical protein
MGGTEVGDSDNLAYIVDIQPVVYKPVVYKPDRDADGHASEANKLACRQPLRYGLCLLK